ncbi:hypothetical protein K8R33_02910 [archaeon]|nr:hypothetical protein [archaeon]
MGKSKLGIVGIIFIVLGIIAVVLIAGELIPAKIPSNPNNPDELKYDLICNIKLKNPLLKDVEIIGTECNWKKSSLFSLYSIFTDKGNLRLEAENKVASLNIELSEGASWEYKLRLTKLSYGETPVIVSFLDEKNKVVATKTISVNIGGG